MLYFAYGSNMNPKRMASRVDYEGKIAIGRLNGFRLVFNKIDYGNVGSGFANVVASNSGFVEGILYSVRKEYLKVLDEYEGVPYHYRRVVKSIETDYGTVDAAVYIATKTATGVRLRPKRSYWYHLAVGARMFLSKDYYNFIMGIKCI